MSTSVIYSFPPAAGAHSGFLSGSHAGCQHPQDYGLKRGTSNQAFRAVVWGRPASFSEQRKAVTAEAKRAFFPPPKLGSVSLDGKLQNDSFQGDSY